MVLDFQYSLLKHLFQDPQAKKYKDYLDGNAFDEPMVKLVYSVWQDYVQKHNVIPPKAAFLEFIDRKAKRTGGQFTDAVYKEALNIIAKAYTPDDQDYDFNRQVIIEYARKRATRNLLVSYADKINKATVDDLNDIYNKMRRIVSIGNDASEDAKNRGGFIFRDGVSIYDDGAIDGHPTFLHTLNSMTAAGGFYTPQHILFVGGPKAFKTGLLICLAVEFARSGLNVFIADGENGINSYRTRIQQALLECERHEVNKYRADLVIMLQRIKRYGGDIAPHFFPQGSTLDDVDAELDRLSAEECWKPNVIIYDPLYKFANVDTKIRDVNLKIQDLNAHAVKLNSKYGMFSMTATKIKADAVNKLVIKKNDLGMDFSQNYDAHAVFALCRTEEEEANGYARIVPVSQREGIGYSSRPEATCALKIDDKRNKITELDSEAYLATLHEEQQQRNPKHRKKYIPPDSLNDD